MAAREYRIPSIILTAEIELDTKTEGEREKEKERKVIAQFSYNENKVRKRSNFSSYLYFSYLIDRGSGRIERYIEPLRGEENR